MRLPSHLSPGLSTDAFRELLAARALWAPLCSAGTCTSPSVTSDGCHARLSSTPSLGVRKKTLAGGWPWLGDHGLRLRVAHDIGRLVLAK